MGRCDYNNCIDETKYFSSLFNKNNANQMNSKLYESDERKYEESDGIKRLVNKTKKYHKKFLKEMGNSIKKVRSVDDIREEIRYNIDQ